MPSKTMQKTRRPVYPTIYFAPRRQSSQKVLGLLDGCNTMLRQSFSGSASVSDDQSCDEISALFSSFGWALPVDKEACVPA
ncbi:hypothetical protein [Caballeronia hypogeia]|uniref:hypothetical protein n=1 Tax=Caballeronia hypogeia TaxID=1777140 RepID=UPI0012FDD681|nr:hypothetical protein [Caballeronia hypogeia]